MNDAIPQWKQDLVRRLSSQSDPEPDAVERLRALLKRYGPLAESEFSSAVVVAIAEIEWAEREHDALQSIIDDLQAQLRAITEAEPRAWEMRKSGKYYYIATLREDMEHSMARGYTDEARALGYIVVPKGDTEE